MRSPFVIKIERPPIYKNFAFWREMGWSDALKLHHFFKELLEAKAEELIKEDGKNSSTMPREELRQYREEASHIMFALRGIPFGINRILPIAAAFALPNILRLRQTSAEAGGGLLDRYHFGILWNKAGNEILGVGTLEKTDAAHEAEVSAWLHPETNRHLAHAAWTAFMTWGQKHSDYQHFKAHVESRTNQQRGNLAARVAANYLGFETIGICEADAPNSNGKTTAILRASNWCARRTPEYR